MFPFGKESLVRRGLSITHVVWTYSASYIIFGFCYAVVGARKYGSGLLTTENAWMAGICLAAMFASYGVSLVDSIVVRMTFLCGCAAGLVCIAGKSSLRGELGILFRPSPQRPVP